MAHRKQICSLLNDRFRAELNRAELHRSCSVYDALEIKSRDRQLIRAVTEGVLCLWHTTRDGNFGQGLEDRPRQFPAFAVGCNGFDSQSCQFFLFIPRISATAIQRRIFFLITLSMNGHKINSDKEKTSYFKNPLPFLTLN